MLSSVVKVIGLGQERLKALLDETLGDKVFYQLNEVGLEYHILLGCRGEDTQDGEFAGIEAGLIDRLGDYFFGHEDDTIEGVTGNLLKEKGLTLAVAESLTGGLITDRITDVAGSSVYLMSGVVVYSNESKTDLLGVPASVMREKGAVSPEVASLMAQGVREKGKTDLGLAVTGTAGPSGGTPLKPVGTVYFSLVSPRGNQVEGKLFSGERRAIKLASSTYALDMVRRLVKAW
jgi:nicotinamide-nucleotide amidase